MKTFTYTIQDEIGIHARPAGVLVKAAKALGSKVTISFKSKTAEATKLMAIMGLGVKHGDEVTVNVEGDNEAADAVQIEDFFKANL